MREGRVIMIEDVASTQDAAIAHNLQVGDACVSFNQTDGRGRRGNRWDSSGGVAVTVVLNHATPHLPIALAATLASQLNNIIPSHTIGIKWPNDLFVCGKKLAGILIEQREGRLLVGVGVNIRNAPMTSAISLIELGFEGSMESIAHLITSSVLDGAQLDETTAITAWRKRDILVGTTQIVQSGDNIIEGTVIDIDPCLNLILETTAGILELPASSSTIITHCKSTT